MDQAFALAESHVLVERSPIGVLGSVDSDGFPNIKAMLNLEHEGFYTIWFSTNTSSKRVAQLRQNPKACVYYVDQEQYKELMLVGTVEVLLDPGYRHWLWGSGCEEYYPLGVDDPDYLVLRFTTMWGNFYLALDNFTFKV
jgi:general stress protein 26